MDKKLQSPSDFAKIKPWDSVRQSDEHETVAQKIMLIMQKDGDQFRPVTWEEYETHYPRDSKKFFDETISFCKSADTAACFSTSWDE